MEPAPEIEPGWALFLDLDGTLIDIAPSPDRVVVPPGLVDHLRTLRSKLGGALAIVSGRTIPDIDRLLASVPFAIAAEHGAIIRYTDGTIHEADASERPPHEWVASLRKRTRTWPGVLVEEKRYAVTVHYRLSPHYKHTIEELVTSLIEDETSRFEIVTAREAFEIRPRPITKGLAVRLLMEREPFRGRIPIYLRRPAWPSDRPP